MQRFKKEKQRKEELKMKKKKKTGIIVIIVIFLLFMIGCVNTGTDTSNSNKEIIVEESNKDTNGNENKEIEMQDSSDVQAEAVIEEQILLDENGIKVTATGMKTDSIWGDGIGLLIENNTTQNIGVGCNALIVNDYMITDLFSSTIAAGKKANETMYISSTELEAAGITNIGQVEIYFHIFDGDSFETLWDSECITIQTSEYANMDTDAMTEGQELYNQDGIRIVGQYVDENSFWGTAVLLYIENTSQKNVGITCENMSVNGFMVSPVFSSSVYSGKKAVDDITIFSSDLENNGIERVEEIEVNFHIYDTDSYSTICDTGAINFNVQ